MKSSEVLLQAMDLIASPEAWLKGSWTRETEDKNKPTCFCAQGAIRFVAKEKFDYQEKIEGYLERVTPNGNIPRFNDNPATTHKMVLEAMTTAAFLALSNSD